MRRHACHIGYKSVLVGAFRTALRRWPYSSVIVPYGQRVRQSLNPGRASLPKRDGDYRLVWFEVFPTRAEAAARELGIKRLVVTDP